MSGFSSDLEIQRESHVHQQQSESRKHRFERLMGNIRADRGVNLMGERNSME